MHRFRGVTWEAQYPLTGSHLRAKLHGAVPESNRLGALPAAQLWTLSPAYPQRIYRLRVTVHADRAVLDVTLPYLRSLYPSGGSLVHIHTRDSTTPFSSFRTICITCQPVSATTQSLNQFGNCHIS